MLVSSSTSLSPPFVPIPSLFDNNDEVISTPKQQGPVRVDDQPKVNRLKRRERPLVIENDDWLALSSPTSITSTSPDSKEVAECTTGWSRRKNPNKQTIDARLFFLMDNEEDGERSRACKRPFLQPRSGGL